MNLGLEMPRKTKQTTTTTKKKKKKKERNKRGTFRDLNRHTFETGFRTILAVSDLRIGEKSETPLTS
jgi:hypothetical protein